VVIRHGPPLVYTVLEPFTYIFLWAFLEVLLWLGILVGSERPFFRRASIPGNLERAFGCLGRHRFLAVIGTFVLLFFGRLALLPITRVPPPRITDDFSELLSADTFAHARVTNPTHPMSFYFETLMQNQKPTYHSMYPPTTGLVMALAQALTGQPWYGMLFAVAAAGAAVCWMLQGWMRPRWALWGSLLFVLYAARNQLAEDYVGEGLTILGAALVLGAVPRIIKRCNLACSAALGIGIALLATTRPYEGAVLVAGIGLGGICWASKAGISAGTLLRKVALPVAFILVPVFLAVGYLNWRSTGSPLVAPYQLNLVQQHITRPLVWQKLADPPPRYDHVEMASFYEQWEVNWWKSIRAFPRGIVLFFMNKASVIYGAILWPLGVVVAIGSYELLKDRTRRFLPLAFVFCLVGVNLETYQLLRRYVEAAAPLVILLAVYGIRYISVWERKSHQGLHISRAARVFIPAACLLCMIISLMAYGYRQIHPYPEPYFSARQHLQQGLEALPGKQLVIVRYSSSHIPYEEWVENRADIDSAKVVWARDVPERGNADLLQYFKDRSVWLLEPDGEELKLTAYGPNKSEAAISQVGEFRVDCCERGCEAPKVRAELAR
jgi:hypothetical protein